MRAANVEQAIELELALLTPEVRRSRLRLEGLLDPDFREIGASGRLWSRAEMIEALSNQDDDVTEPIQAVDFIGTSLGPDLVLLTYVSDPEGRAARRSSLWRRPVASWRLLHHQGTLLSDE